MAPTGEIKLGRADQTIVSFVDQRGGGQRLAAAHALQPNLGETLELGVEMIENRLQIRLTFNGVQKLGYFGHLGCSLPLPARPKPFQNGNPPEN
jgi:hypothetical protein